MVTDFLPPAWRDLSGGQTEIRLEASTVRQVLFGLEGSFPGIRERAIANDSLKPGLAVAINGTVSRLGLRAPVPAEAEVHFLPALGGG